MPQKESPKVPLKRPAGREPNPKKKAKKNEEEDDDASFLGVCKGNRKDDEDEDDEPAASAKKEKKRRKKRKARLGNLKRRQRNLPGPVVEKGKERRQKMALNKRMIAQGHPASPKGKVVCL